MFYSWTGSRLFKHALKGTWNWFQSTTLLKITTLLAQSKPSWVSSRAVISHSNKIKVYKADFTFKILAIANKSGEENYDVGNDFWTAGTNLWGPDNSEFYWATNGRLISEFTNWHAGTPNFPEEQHCIEITKEIDAVTAGTYKWNDYGCHIPARYICRAITLSSDIIN